MIGVSYQVGDKDTLVSHLRQKIKRTWDLMLSVGLTIATLRSDNGDVHENVAER